MSMPGIVIKIGAQTNDAIQGINKVERALGRQLTATERLNRISMANKAAFLGIAAAAGTAAIAIGVDAVQAAADDERAMKSLNQTLGNLGFRSAAGEVEGLIGRMQKLYGIADNDLRGAFDRLVRSTRDVGEAERALQIAVDAAAGSGKSLEQVANALGRAYDGNTGALGKLGLGLDAVTLKSGDMKVITAAMASTFAGQAATAASTLSGQMQVLRTRVDEAVESLGYDLVRAINTLSGGTKGGLDNAASLVESLTANVGDLVVGMSEVVDALRDVVPYLSDTAQETESAADAQTAWTDRLRTWNPFVAAGLDLLLRFGIATGETEQAQLDAANATGVWAARMIGLANAIQATRLAQANQAVASRYTALAVQDYDASIRYAGGNMQEWLASLNATQTALGGGGGGGGGVAGAVDKVNPRLAKQITLTERHIEQLTGPDGLVAKLKALKEEQQGYADSLTSTLMNGISLGDAYSQAAEKAGEGGAVDWVSGFVKQIEDTAAFSAGLANLANALPNTPGAKALIEQLSGVGAATGNAILTGLTPEVAAGLAGKLDGVLGSTTIAGGAIAQKFYGEGVAAAEQLVTAMEAQIKKDEAKLRAIGAAVGQAIGAEIKAAVATALSEAAAARSAAPAAGGTVVNITGATVIDPANGARAITSAINRGQARRGTRP